MLGSVGVFRLSSLSRSPVLGSLPLTIAEISPARRIIQNLAAFSGFGPTHLC
jgi:hypothetical protein